MSLADVIRQVRANTGDRDNWLLIHGDPKDLRLATDCALSRVDIDEESEDFEEILPAEYVARGLAPTIDYETLQACVVWADRLSGAHDDEAAAEIIRYYIRFDDCPDTLGAPDPPPVEEVIARLDRKFFDSLGPERDGTQCKNPNCTRGTVPLSAFCAAHHFEKVQGKPCPF